jgi:hypothetical protein
MQFPESYIESYPANGEPKVLTEDVRIILRRVIRPDDDDGGSVQMIAERAETSTRTVYRVLSPTHSDAISLDLADRLCLAAGSHVALCRLRWPDGRTTSYF